MAFVRAKGPDGAEFTIDEAAASALGARVLKKPAVDVNGRPLPDKPYVDLAGRTVADLRELADEQGVDLGDATRKDDILTALAGDGANKEN